jgi:hypothetical protein
MVEDTLREERYELAAASSLLPALGEDRGTEFSTTIAVLHSGARPTARLRQFSGVSLPHRSLERTIFR